MLQISFLPQISLFGGLANLVLVIIISLILITRFDEALLWLGLGGLLLDLFSPLRLGLYFFPLILIYFTTRLLVQKLLAHPPWSLSLLFFFSASLLVDLPWLFYESSSYGLVVWSSNAVHNALLGCLIYYFLQYYYQPKESIKI